MHQRLPREAPRPCALAPAYHLPPVARLHTTSGQPGQSAVLIGGRNCLAMALTSLLPSSCEKSPDLAETATAEYIEPRRLEQIVPFHRWSIAQKLGASQLAQHGRGSDARAQVPPSQARWKEQRLESSPGTLSENSRSEARWQGQDE
eukprot:6207616-Pleurochrysis_carterae.AAC.3